MVKRLRIMGANPSCHIIVTGNEGGQLHAETKLLLGIARFYEGFYTGNACIKTVPSASAMSNAAIAGLWERFPFERAHDPKDEFWLVA